MTMTVLEERRTAATGAVLEIDLAAVAANVERLRALTAVPLMAVVKADGFGHGDLDVAATALAAGVGWFGVTSIEEAVALRTAHPTTPVLSWLNPVDADFATAVRLGIDVAVADTAHLVAVAHAAAAVGRRAGVHLHCDTGMARDGAPIERWPDLCRTARAAEVAGLVQTIGVMGHLPCADNPFHKSNADGRRTFDRAVTVAIETGLRPTVRHLAGTAAAMLDADARADLVRIGAGLYGIGPDAGPLLTPAMTLSAPVVLSRRVRAGTGIGYGHDTVTVSDTSVALLPVGYADGIPRRLDPDASVWLDGRRCRIVGRVSMDQIVVDTGDRQVSIGSRADVFGTAGRGMPTAREWAVWAGTVEHDIVTGIGARVRRATVGGAR